MAWECFLRPQHRITMIKTERPKLLKTPQVKRHVVDLARAPGWTSLPRASRRRRSPQPASDRARQTARGTRVGRAVRGGSAPSSAWRTVLTQHARGSSGSSAGDGAASRAFKRFAPGDADRRGPQAGLPRVRNRVGGAMRRSKADVERYIASVQGSAPSPREVSGPWGDGQPPPWPGRGPARRRRHGSRRPPLPGAFRWGAGRFARCVGRRGARELLGTEQESAAAVGAGASSSSWPLPAVRAPSCPGPRRARVPAALFPAPGRLPAASAAPSRAKAAGTGAARTGPWAAPAGQRGARGPSLRLWSWGFCLCCSRPAPIPGALWKLLLFAFFFFFNGMLGILNFLRGVRTVT